VRTKLRRAAWLAAALAACGTLSTGQFLPPRSEQGPRLLYYEALPIPGDSLHGRVDIHFRVDREFFVPVRDPDARTPFHRSGELVVELADSAGGVAGRAMHPIEIPCEDADRHPAGEEWEQGMFSLAVSPGRYRIQVTLEDGESRRTIMDSTKFVRVPPPGASGLATASVVPVAPPRAGTGLPAGLTIMNFAGEILFGRPEALLVTWKTRSAPDTLLTVKYSFEEEPPAPEDAPFLPPAGTVTVPVYRGVELTPFTDSAGYRVSRDPGAAASAAIVPVPFARLLLRSYRMTFTLTSGTDREEIVRKGRAVWPDMPFTLKDIDNALDALKYITTETELDSLRRGSMEERRAHLEGFWRAKGGRPETAFNDVMTEYYRRADHATRNFGTLRQPDGFRSDRGRIYVLYGPPSSTDRMLDPVSGFHEVWTYSHLKKKFVFVDQNKSGNYVLVSATAL